MLPSLNVKNVKFNITKVTFFFLLLAFWILPVSTALAQSQLPAFPGAEGFGASATGGRGGKVIKVTNLNASGPGSLQDAISQSGPRIVVFEVSGEILGDVTIFHGDLTIAGQTAPGAGITIRGRLYSRYEAGIDNIIIRHIRVRPLMYDSSLGSGDGYDAIRFSMNKRLILDHISVSWGVDETVDVYGASDVTIQWSTIEESAISGHPKGRHNYALLNVASHISLLNNLFANNDARNPAIAAGPAEVINNVVYNGEVGFHHHNPARGAFNIIGNYYKKGPSTSRIIPFSLDYEGDPGPGLAYCIGDNYIDDPGKFVGVVQNPWVTPYLHPEFWKIEPGREFRLYSAVDFMNIYPEYIPTVPQDSESIFDVVLSKAGAFPRDVVTLRTVDEVRNRNGSWGAKEPENIMEGLVPTSYPEDTDNDGMPDTWELERGLDPTHDIDHSQVMPSGYTAIEEYINELADNITVDST